MPAIVLGFFTKLLNYVDSMQPRGTSAVKQEAGAQREPLSLGHTREYTARGANQIKMCNFNCVPRKIALFKLSSLVEVTF